MMPLARGALSAALVLGICGFGIVPASADDTVNIPDEALHACIAAELAAEKLPPEFSTTNLAQVRTLSCFDKNLGQIKNLTGLDHLVAVERFDAFGTTVSDLGPLSGLARLSLVEILSSESYSLAPLTTLPSLTRAAVSVGPTTDTAPIAQLTHLQQLHLDVRGMARSPDVDLPPGVKELDVAADLQLTGLGKVTGGTGVTRVVVMAPKLTSLDGLEGLTSATYLYAGYSNLTDVSALAGMSSLDELTLNANPSLGNLVGIEGLASLRTLDLSADKLSNLDDLAGLTGLETLKLDQNAISDLSPLTSLSRLRTLSLWQNRVTDLAPLAMLPALTSLQVSGNLLSDLGPDGTFHRLTYLAAFDNRITSLAGLARARLTAADLRWNQISDVGPLRDIAPGAQIQLGWNRVRDFSPLPDGVRPARSEQDLGRLPDAAVGKPLDLGVRDTDGTRMCPTFSRPATCANGVVTYSASGTYQGSVTFGTGAQAEPSIVFSQYVAPDLAFAHTYKPTVGGAPFVGTSVQPRFSPWRPQPDNYTYQWYRNSTPIPGEGAHEFNYAVVAADLGRRLSVCVTGHRDGYAPATRCSGPSAKVLKGWIHDAAKPKVTGNASTEAVLTAVPGAWETGTTLHYQWQKDHRNIKGQTAATYTVRAGDIGRGIRVRVTGTKPACTSTTRYSATVHPKRAKFMVPTPTTTGVAAAGSVLTAEPGVWVPKPSHMSYRWYRDNKAIRGATHRTYLLTETDVGRAVKVKVTGSRSGYTTASANTVPVVPVAA